MYLFDLIDLIDLIDVYEGEMYGSSENSHARTKTSKDFGRTA